MNAMRDAWTDERLDDLTERMEKDFRGVDERFDRLERRMDQGFGKVERAFSKQNARMDQEFGQVNARFDSLQQTIIAVGGGLIGTLIVASAGVIATQI